MKAILKEDMIINFSETGTEIGNIPKGSDVSRMRFDGVNLIDLNTLDQMWVREITPGFFELHVTAVSNSQLVSMTYNQRKYLFNDAGTIRVKTQEEIYIDEERTRQTILKNRLFKRFKIEVGSLEEQLNNVNVLIFALIVYASTGNSDLKQFFDTLTPEIKDIYPLNEVRTILINAVKGIGNAVSEYYENKSDSGSI